MKLGTTTHPKFRRLQKQLRLPQYAVVGLLEMLWMMTSQYADDGDISKFTSQEIADYCDFEGDADSLVDGLVACRWIDRDADSLRIHDWEDHRPSYVEDRIRKREERARKRDLSQDCPGQSETVAIALGKSLPSHAMPNHSPTMPCQTKPNQINPAAASLPPAAAADFDFSIFADSEDYRERVRNASGKLFVVAGKVLSRELIWQVAWISEAIQPGFCSDMQVKLKTGTANGPIKSYRRYVMRALEDELAKVGLGFAQCLLHVPECPKVPQAV
jgi:hypothetical protein